MDKAAAAARDTATAADAEAYEAFEAYNFDSDNVFQAGLQTLSNTVSAGQLLRAKAFYYSKVAVPIDIAKYQAWKSAQGAGTQETRSEKVPEGSNEAAGAPGAPYSASFAEIAEMVMLGKQVPGIRQIPDKLSRELPSVSTTRPPLKPWEKQGE